VLKRPPTPKFSLLDLAGVRVELGDLLGRDTDVVIREDALPRFWQTSRTTWSRRSDGASTGRRPAPTHSRCHCQDRDTAAGKAFEDYAAARDHGRLPAACAPSGHSDRQLLDMGQPLVLRHGFDVGEQRRHALLDHLAHVALGLSMVRPLVRQPEGTIRPLRMGKHLLYGD
jgi:hypothetical protein